MAGDVLGYPEQQQQQEKVGNRISRIHGEGLEHELTCCLKPVGRKTGSVFHGMVTAPLLSGPSRPQLSLREQMKCPVLTHLPVQHIALQYRCQRSAL